MTTQAPYGSWASPITAGRVATAGIALAAPVASGADIWWQEQRPAEGGRIVVVRRNEDGFVKDPPNRRPIQEDLVPEGFNARTQVHEYGGGAWCVHGRTLYFSNWTDQRLYRVDDPDPPNRRPVREDPVAITPKPEIERGLRYADGVVSPDGEWIVCVRERHREGAEAVNEIVALPTDGSGEGHVLVSGNDFYAFPRVSPDGSRLAWIEWSHPNMPWDGTELFVADFAPTAIGDAEPVAGGQDEAIFQPEWSPTGELHFVSDRNGWWNIYGPRGCVLEMEAEFGVPLWVFGLSTYTFLPDGTIVCSYAEDGDWTLGVIEEAGMRGLGVSKDRGSYVRAFGDRVVTVAAGPAEHSAIVVVDPRTGEREELKRSSSQDIDPRYTSVPEAISFPSGGRVAHAFYYPPHNDDFEAGGRVPEDELPPLLVLSHGGPTAQVHPTYSASVQFWTSRGLAVVDVNYGGSTGYGRAYRRLLNGSWGVVDLEDCTAAARYLVERGDVDGERLAIRGGSAGGYTTLCALTFTDVFKAGANYFGVADMTTFVGDTHKFESRYLDSLVGPWPEAKDLYHDRSPTNFVDRISCPVITFQGSEDEIVPPSQSEQVVEALRSKGVPCAYVLYEGEQHGFRKSENIEHSLSSELYFYGRVFDFTPADDLEPVEIEGL